MANRVRIPAALKQWTNGERLVEVEGSSISDAIDQLCTRFPGVGERVLDEDKRLRRFVNVYVNGEDIRLLQGEQTPLGDNDEIVIAPAVAGGQ
jgi:molybdopterin synthase sulfur carrier subunit